jgi:hypothetical protein
LIFKVIRKLFGQICLSHPSSKFREGGLWICPRMLWIGSGLREIVRIVVFVFYTLAVLILAVNVFPVVAPMKPYADVGWPCLDCVDRRRVSV